MVTHSSIPAWEIPRTEEPGRLWGPWGHEELDRTEQANNIFTLILYFMSLVLLKHVLIVSYSCHVVSISFAIILHIYRFFRFCNFKFGDYVYLILLMKYCFLLCFLNVSL